MASAHFVLVHGACHGAWCWYKVLDLLRRAGHQATAIDLAASGVHPADPDTIRSFQDYNGPLSRFLSSLHPSQLRKVILVGHSLGGHSITHACEEFPNQLAALVYVAAHIVPSGLPLKEHFRVLANYSFEFFYADGPDNDPTSLIFTPDSVKDILYSSSPPEDVVLASILLRPNPVASQLAPKLNLTEEGFHSIPKAYIKTRFDHGFPTSSQEDLAREYGIKDIFTLDSDHSPFFSAAKELQACLLEVQAKYGSH